MILTRTLKVAIPAVQSQQIVVSFDPYERKLEGQSSIDKAIFCPGAYLCTAFAHLCASYIERKRECLSLCVCLREREIARKLSYTALRAISLMFPITKSYIAQAKMTLSHSEAGKRYLHGENVLNCPSFQRSLRANLLFLINIKKHSRAR